MANFEMSNNDFTRSISQSMINADSQLLCQL